MQHLNVDELETHCGVAGGVVAGTTATVPGVPQSVTISSIATTSAVVSWTAPATNGGSAVTGYDISITYPHMRRNTTQHDTTHTNVSRA
jgi:hypothetical protein